LRQANLTPVFFISQKQGDRDDSKNIVVYCESFCFNSFSLCLCLSFDNTFAWKGGERIEGVR